MWQAGSTVAATLAEGVSTLDVLQTVLPGGSVTGAPKQAACTLLAGLEPVGRGPSMGALGLLWPGGLDLGLTIRTIAVDADRVHLWAGGGITWGSEPRAEVFEAHAKAAPVAGGPGPALSPVRRALFRRDGDPAPDSGPALVLLGPPQRLASLCAVVVGAAPVVVAAVSHPARLQHPVAACFVGSTDRGVVVDDHCDDPPPAPGLARSCGLATRAGRRSPLRRIANRPSGRPGPANQVSVSSRQCSGRPVT